jgi:drug/metabolite transporter (DMT)-like permease
LIDGEALQIRGVGYALPAAALFGASTPAAKLLLLDLSPLMLSALLYRERRQRCPGIDFLWLLGRAKHRLTRHDTGLIISIVFFGGMLGPVLMLLGLRRLSGLTASLLLNLEPRLPPLLLWVLCASIWAGARRSPQP